MNYRYYFICFLTLSIFTVNINATDKDNIKLVNLYDNIGEPIKGTLSDWGYSIFIDYHGTKILFDGGASAKILKHNAEQLGIDLSEIEIAMISHNHADHTTGIDYLVAINPDVRLYVPGGWGFAYGNTEEYKKYQIGYRYPVENLEIVENNIEISEGIHIINTESKLTGIFSKYPPNEENPRFRPLPELSLVLEQENSGVILVSGCSHSQIEEIVKETIDSLNVTVDFATGGFHLLPYSEDYIKKLALTLKDQLNVKYVAPTHCTGEDAISIIRDVYNNDFKKGGLGTEFIFP
jgi:7,8-dihydropterin-6-yl-methyl-4-(beta-D-ribofuranosyl)aminobenzene 5'-phosphate synthase